MLKRVVLIIAIILVPIVFGGYYYWWTHYHYLPVSTPGGVLTISDVAGANDPSILAAGNIATCDNTFDEATAKILGNYPTDTILPLGNSVFPQGTFDAYTQCFAPSWGKYKERMKPIPGNRDYQVPGAAGYFQYYRRLAGNSLKGYYSYDIGAWHIVALNSNCSAIGGCAKSSPEYSWLSQDLASHPAACTLAYIHHPPFTSGNVDQNPEVRPLWQLLNQQGVEVVLAAHDRFYERFKPMDGRGRENQTAGTREFIVGSGGRGTENFGRIVPTSQVRDNTTYGVLRLTLHEKRYDWLFLAAANGSFSDGGTGTCH